MQYSFKAALALFLHTNMLSVTLRLSAKKNNYRATMRSIIPVSATDTNYLILCLNG